MRCKCGIDTPRPVIIGVQRDMKDIPVAVLWNCASGSTHAIPIENASERLLLEAHEIDFARLINAGLG